MDGLPSILELLDLEYIEENIYRSCVTFAEPHRLFGGQVAAQALYAAGKTVPAGRLPHSLHGYFLRAGDAHRPTLFRVDRDRDGGASSARRVVAIQNGEVIFNMAASFARRRVIDEPLLDRDATATGPFPAIGDLPAHKYPRHPSFEFRHQLSTDRLPERFWIRCVEPLPAAEDDPLLHAALLTYISDISSGLIRLEPPGYTASSSIDHAVWLHRQARMDGWIWQEMRPETAAGGRGWYTGACYHPDGTRVASIAQEALFRKTVTT
ncbi:MAG TPA: acyl-CoA thioesterase domain-containing protein [Trebonia sp.]|nr:acyl-CoA thioesterase domain-containing protein [Trebonia sp.]